MMMVRADAPNPTCAAMVLEQFAGANGEPKAALQYLVQRFGAPDDVVHERFLDVGIEQLSHLEPVGTLGSWFLAPVHRGSDDTAADPRLRRAADPWRAAACTVQKTLVAGGGGPEAQAPVRCAFAGDPRLRRPPAVRLPDPT